MGLTGSIKDSRNRATIAGANVEFPGGKLRLLVNYVSRKIGEPGTRRVR